MSKTRPVDGDGGGPIDPNDPFTGGRRNPLVKKPKGKKSDKNTTNKPYSTEK